MDRAAALLDGSNNMHGKSVRLADASCKKRHNIVTFLHYGFAMIIEINFRTVPGEKCLFSTEPSVIAAVEFVIGNLTRARDERVIKTGASSWNPTAQLGLLLRGPCEARLI